MATDRIDATPLSERKRKAIRAAGRDVFLRMGYDAASMDLIASEAGVAKQTVYSHFRNKETLFRAIVADLAGQLVPPLRTECRAASGPARVLTAFARGLLSQMLQPSALALHRMVVGEGNRFPELSRELYEAGPAHAVKELAGYLATQTKTGLLAIDEPELAAEQFFGMLTGLIQWRALLGVRDDRASTDLDKAIRQAVRAFLRSYAPVARRPRALRPRRTGRGAPRQTPAGVKGRA